MDLSNENNKEHQEPEVHPSERTHSHLTPFILAGFTMVFATACYFIAGKWLGVNDLLNTIHPQLAHVLWGAVILSMLVISALISSVLTHSDDKH